MKCFLTGYPTYLDPCAGVSCEAPDRGVVSDETENAICVPDCIMDIGGCPADQICEIRTYGYNESLVNLFHVSTTKTLHMVSIACHDLTSVIIIPSPLPPVHFGLILINPCIGGSVFTDLM